MFLIYVVHMHIMYVDYWECKMHEWCSTGLDIENTKNVTKFK